MSTAYDHLTVGEIKALTPEKIETYAFDVGVQRLDDPKVKHALAMEIGRRVINAQIRRLYEMEEQLEG